MGNDGQRGNLCLWTERAWFPKHPSGRGELCESHADLTTQIAVMINAIAFLAKTFWLFTPSPAFFSRIRTSISGTLDTLVSEIFASERARPACQERIDNDILLLERSKRPPTPAPPPQPRGRSQASQHPKNAQRHGTQPAKGDEKPLATLPDNPARQLWFEELAFAVTDLTEASCWFSGEMRVWYVWISIRSTPELKYRAGAELVDVAMGLTATHLDLNIVVRTVGIILAASMCMSIMRPEQILMLS